jgi:hypothetical protein
MQISALSKRRISAGAACRFLTHSTRPDGHGRFLLQTTACLIFTRNDAGSGRTPVAEFRIALSCPGEPTWVCASRAANARAEPADGQAFGSNGHDAAIRTPLRPDDCMTKPFHKDELVARILAIEGARPVAREDW